MIFTSDEIGQILYETNRVDASREIEKLRRFLRDLEPGRDYDLLAEDA